MLFRSAAAALGLLLLSASAAEPDAPTVSAPELARRLSAKQQDGTSHIRLRMNVSGEAKAALQLQIKSRASRASTELVYQVLFPKERKGEAVLLRKSGGRISGALFTPPDAVRPLATAQLDEPLFGSDLSYEDVIDDFFGWDQQAIVGTGVVDRVSCTILESKPGKDERSSYTSVRTWVDMRRLVPLRIEKYSGSSRLVRRIETTRVVTDDKGRAVPANLAVRGPRGSVTDLDGSRLKHGVTYADAEFTPEGLRELTTPRAAPE
ncbi:MAG: outer membrane lipoprotein-sorting protein [Verrucomicrobiota bacterium]|nr:outer membrane lipoprotein-sorting protein [Verrucomicrobiota bacterium]